jgi:hypothetical protein
VLPVEFVAEDATGEVGLEEEKTEVRPEYHEED